MMFRLKLLQISLKERVKKRLKNRTNGALLIFTLPIFTFVGPGASILVQAETPDFAASTHATSHQPTDPPLSELLNYYPHVLDGLIVPSGSDSSDLQDAFRLDVDGFIQREHAPDFVTARRRYYSRLDFSGAQQSHDRPYYYISSWGSLFHPPVKRLELPIENYVREFSNSLPSGADITESEYFAPDFQRDIDHTSGTQLTRGNKLALLANGDGFQEKLRLARESKKYFFGIVMFFVCDQSSNELVDALAERRREGVDVRIIVEGFYSSTVFSGCVKKMRDAGIDVLVMSEILRPKNLFGVMHNKFWIRDGEEAIIGGQNMVNYENLSTGFNGMARDTDLHIQSGPAITDLMQEFTKLWRQYGRKNRNAPIDRYLKIITQKAEDEKSAGLRGTEYYEDWLLNHDSRMDGLCRIVVQGSGADTEAISPVLARYIEAARTHILFTTPSARYDTTRPDMRNWENRLAELYKQRAETGNVRIDVISNGYGGGLGYLAETFQDVEQAFANANLPALEHLLIGIGDFFDRNGARSYRKSLLDLAHSKNVRTWTYFQFLHAKFYLFDRVLTGIGSFNFDNNSAEKNHEAIAFCMDENLRRQAEKQFALDLSNSIPVVSRNRQ